MVKIYESIRDEYGNWISGLSRLFVISTEEDGTISRFESGSSVPSESGTLLIVDDWLIPQVHKLTFIDGKISVKDGETIEEPIKSEVEIQEEELLRQLAELRAKRSGEPTE